MTDTEARVEAATPLVDGPPAPRPVSDPPAEQALRISGRIGRRATLATTSLIAAQVASAPLVFLGLKMITNGVGRADYGVYATCFSFTAIFALLADLGVNAVTAREVARDPARANEVVPAGIGLRVALSLVVAPTIVLASLAVYPSAIPQLHLGVALVAVTFVPDAVRAVLFGYLTARARNHWVAAASLGQQVLYLALVWLSLQRSLGLLGLFLSYFVASALSTAVVAVLLRRSVSVRPRISWPAWRLLLGASLSIGTIQLINLLYLRVDSLMISVLVGPSAVGLYAVAYTVINGAAPIPGFLMSSLLPGIMRSDAQARRALLARALDVLSLLGALLVSLLALAAPAVVSFISGPAFSASAAPLLLLGVATLFTYMNSVFGYSSTALDVHRPIVFISLAGLLLNVVLNAILIPSSGITGAAIATLVCEVLIFAAIFVYFRRRTGLRVALAPAMLRAAAVIGVALLLGRLSSMAIASAPVVVQLAVAVVESLIAGGIVLGLQRLPRVVRRVRTR